MVKSAFEFDILVSLLLIRKDKEKAEHIRTRVRGPDPHDRRTTEVQNGSVWGAQDFEFLGGHSSVYA